MTTKMIKVSFRVITVQVLCFLFNFFLLKTLPAGIFTGVISRDEAES